MDAQKTNVEYNRSLGLKPLSDEEALAQYKASLGEGLEGQPDQEIGGQES